MTWGKVYFLSFSIIIAAFIVGFAIRPIHTDEPPLAEQIIPRPFRPIPPLPRPEPLEENDGKMFERIRKHVEYVSEERASRRVEAALQEVADKLESTNAEGVILSTGEPSQFIGTSLIVSAIIAVVKRIVVYLIKMLIVGAILGVLYMYWPWIAGGFAAASTVVFWTNAGLLKLLGKKE